MPDPNPKQKRNSLGNWIWLGVIILFLIGVGIFNRNKLNHKPTLEERQKEALAEALEKSRKAEAAEQERQFIDHCRLQKVCEKYSQVRQDCAVAGDFDKCVEVRMGDESYRIAQCGQDGRIIYEEKPTIAERAECAATLFLHRLK